MTALLFVLRNFPKNLQAVHCTLHTDIPLGQQNTLLTAAVDEAQVHNYSCSSTRETTVGEQKVALGGRKDTLSTP